ncbi:hypothetical protein BT93_J1259 [Corymbia citriodora subsp. variegata]|nr:hypothetical protein BT93_J1259 [Corymbia citriodora subsp. variegata]
MVYNDYAKNLNVNKLKKLQTPLNHFLVSRLSNRSSFPQFRGLPCWISSTTKIKIRAPLRTKQSEDNLGQRFYGRLRYRDMPRMLLRSRNRYKKLKSESFRVQSTYKRAKCLEEQCKGIERDQRLTIIYEKCIQHSCCCI